MLGAMLCRISGTLEAIADHTVTIGLADGSAREVLVPAFLAARLKDTGATGQALTLATLEYLESRDQGASFIPRLIGFSAAQDRAFFELFTTVKGIGNRKALRAMAREPAQIARAIAARDTHALQELPEIGKRMAETVIAELHGKVEGFLSGAEVAGLNASAAGRAEPRPGELQGAAAEAAKVLVALGETRADAEHKAREAAARAGDRATPEQIVARVFAGR